MYILDKIYNEVFDFNVMFHHTMVDVCKLRFPQYVTTAVSNNLLMPEYLDCDLYTLADHIDAELDHSFPTNTLQELYDNVLLRVNEVVIETPQYFLMRLAMYKNMNRTDAILSAYKYYANTLDLDELGPDFVFYGLTKELRDLNKDNNFDYHQYFKHDIVIK